MEIIHPQIPVSDKVKIICTNCGISFKKTKRYDNLFLPCRKCGKHTLEYAVKPSNHEWRKYPTTYSFW